jgi:hypothetical protein
VRRLLLLGLTVPCVASACGSSPLGALDGKSPKAILSLAEQAMDDAHHSFHFADETEVDDETTTVTGNDSGVGAEETLSGAAPNLQVVRTANGTIYVRGAAAALESALGLSSATAASHVSAWIRLSPSDKPYTKVDDALAWPSEIDYYLPQSSLHLVSSKPIGGHNVIGVTGKAPAADDGNGATATLFVPTSAPFTPAGASLNFGKGSSAGTEVVLFGEWGTQVRPSAPSGAVSLSSVQS